MSSGPARRPRRSRARGRRFPGILLSAGLLACASGCGIGASVMDECLPEKRVYESAQKRKTSLTIAGVPRDAAVHRAAARRLARARSEHTACTAARSGA